MKATAKIRIPSGRTKVKKAIELAEYIKGGAFDDKLTAMYGTARLEEQRRRWYDAAESFAAMFGDRPVMMFSVPGRSEICGNHTDHNHGAVMAAAIDLDTIGAAAVNENGSVRLFSEGYGLTETMSDANESDVKRGTSASLVAGMCDSLRHEGYECGGFDVWCTSQVLEGSGLSSSASFEVFVGTVINHLFNCGSIDPVTVARAAQRAENVFFGKPCGLMDQTACAVGGFVFIDFEDPQKPVVRKLSHDLADMGMLLCITDTGGSHADLTDDYASIPAEMKAVALELGCSVLRDADEGEFYDSLARLRGTCSDRALLRAAHFFAENRRVFEAADAVENCDREGFLDVVRRSGDSSFKYLQNLYSPAAPEQQGLPLALALSGDVVCRVHGGGFAGTVQAFLDPARLEQYRSRMESVFGAGSCRCLNVRSAGAARLL